MNQHVTLIGTEQVQRAGYQMADAAQSFSNSSQWLIDALQQHQRFMDEWIQRFEAVLRSHAAPLEGDDDASR